MRGSWSLLVTLALALPGCIQPDAPPAEPTPPPPTPPPMPPSPCPDCGGPVDRMPPHEHDYWMGETRKVVLQLESGLVPLPLIPCKRPGCSADNPAGDADNYPLGTAIADYDVPLPPEGGMVYEGTGSVEVLLNWVRVPGTPESTTHPGVNVMLDYLTAADGPGEFRPGGELRVGQPLVIPVKPLEADMPHQQKSLWVFRVSTKEPNAFDFNLTVTAVRGDGDIATWPPHPNVYADRPSRAVFDGEQKLSSKGSASYWVDGSDPGWIFPDRTISWGTDEIDVVVKDVSVAALSQPSKFVLEYHNASFVPKLGNGDQAGARAEPATVEGGTYTFVLPVDALGYDSPYGAKSRWGFRFLPRYDGAGATCIEGTEALLAGCQWLPSDVSAHVTVTARGHPLT